MLLIAAAVLALLAVPLTGRDLSRLAGLRLRGIWLVVAALVVQTVIVSFDVISSPTVDRVAHLASYGALGVVLWWNRAMPWLWLVTLGGACNVVAIVANGGVMPASRSALEGAGLPTTGGFANSGVVDSARLAFLGDVFHTPRGMPLANVFSIGDALLALGVLLLVLAVTRREPVVAATEPAVPSPST
jgi:Family of unknown function (DUF5317)